MKFVKFRWDSCLYLYIFGRALGVLGMQRSRARTQMWKQSG